MQEDDILNRFSSYHKALRVLCYVFRFFNNTLRKIRSNISVAVQNELTQNEMIFVKCRLLILSQKAFYSQEYQCLEKQQTLDYKSPLNPLNPFLDTKSVLRVNGRLSRSCLPYNERYPKILPGSSRLCNLYLTYLHDFLAHAECSQMCRMVQTEFYIVRLKPRVKKIIRNCKTCIIQRKQSCSQIMAPLPPE